MLTTSVLSNTGQVIQPDNIEGVFTGYAQKVLKIAKPNTKKVLTPTQHKIVGIFAIFNTFWGGASKNKELPVASVSLDNFCGDMLHCISNDSAMIAFHISFPSRDHIRLKS